MGLLQRISDLLRSNINDLISRAEDPEKILNAAIEDMQKQLIEAKSRVAMSIADEKRLQKQHESQLAKAQDWEKKAMAAVKAGRDDLAVEALSKKKEHEAAALQFEIQFKDQRQAVDTLKQALTQLTGKLEETKRKRTLLIARSKRAKAQKQIAETMSAANKASAFDKLDALEERVERQEAEAEATWELAALSTGSEDELSREIRMLESGSSDEDLLELKDKMRTMGLLGAGNNASAATNGDNADLVAELEDDLAELKRRAAGDADDEREVAAATEDS